MQFQLGNVVFVQDDSGSWIAKGIETKKDGTLKPKYKDLPRYKAIYEIEDEFQNSFDRNLKDMVKNIKDLL